MASSYPDVVPMLTYEDAAAALDWLAAVVVDGLLVRVEDVDAHLERARKAGAVILSEPESEDYGRLYRAEDLEGHRWMFIQGMA